MQMEPTTLSRLESQLALRTHDSPQAFDAVVPESDLLPYNLVRLKRSGSTEDLSNSSKPVTSSGEAMKLQDSSSTNLYS